jgi:hypothetical protein
MYKRFLRRSFDHESIRGKDTEVIALLNSMAGQRSKEMRDYAASRRRGAAARKGARRAGANGLNGPVSIRRLEVDGSDREPLRRLAGRDSATAPRGEVLGAERDGQLVAAVSATSGDVVADPFLPTAAIVERLKGRVSTTAAA